MKKRAVKQSALHNRIWKVPSLLLSFIRGAPVIPLIIILVFIFAGVFGNLITPHNPTKYNLRTTLIPPFWAKGGEFKHVLGTDSMGRDMLSRIIAGARVSLTIGFTAVAIAGGFGCIVALLAGYLGGKMDTVLMRLTDTMLSMPYILVALALVGVLGASIRNLILVLGIIGWAGYARVLRGEVLRLRESDFIQLAVVSGCNKARIMIIHIFPNIINTLVVMATLQLGVTILAEASLSFLGLGIPPPTPAWGSMVADGREYMGSAWWLSVFPGVAVLLVVLSCNFIGDWLRVRLDPKFRQI